MTQQVQGSSHYTPIVSELNYGYKGVASCATGFLFLGGGALIKILDSINQRTTDFLPLSLDAGDFFTRKGIRLIKEGCKPTLCVAGVSIAIIKLKAKL